MARRTASPKKKPLKPPRPARDALSGGPGLPPLAVKLGAGCIVLAALALTGLMMDWPGRLNAYAAERIAAAGFEVTDVNVSGNRAVERLDVLAIVLAGDSNSMFHLDVDEVREQLLAMPWVADASVRRRLPNRVDVAIVERVPFAVWQYQRKLHVIDKSGRVLTNAVTGDHASLPMVLGERANETAFELFRQLARHPAVRERLSLATYRGKRRWDLAFDGGELLMLPEGEAETERALRLFAEMDAEEGLLNRGFARFDMRLPNQMMVLPAAAGETPKPLPQAAAPAAPSVPNLVSARDKAMEI